MNIKNIISKAVRISLIPSIEWKVIGKEQNTPKELLWNYIFPIILFSAIGRDIGVFFSVKPVLGYSLNLVWLLLFNLVSWVVIPYVLLLSAVYVLNFGLPKLGVETDFVKIIKLVVYTFTPIFFVTFFVYLHPLLRILIPIGIYVFVVYTLYVFWYGVQELLQITFEKKLRFIILMVIVGFFVIFLTQHIYGLLLDWFMPGMAAYVK